MRDVGLAPAESRAKIAPRRRDRHARLDRGAKVMNRIFILLAGLAGAIGVALAARDAHPGVVTISPSTDLLETASTILMIHAPALLAIGVAGAAGRILAVGGAAITLGLILFCGELTLHTLTGEGAFAYAAPIGGVLLILGWLIVAGAVFVRKT